MNPTKLLLIFLQMGFLIGLGVPSSLAQALEDPAKLSQKRFLKAVDELKARHWSRSRADFKKVLIQDPNNLKAHFYLGEVEYYAHHLSQAESYFQWVDRQSPSMPVNHYYWGRVEYDLKHYNQALSELEKADQLDGQISIVHYYLGLIHYKKNDLPQAQEEFQLAIQLDPASSKAHYALAYLLYHDLHKRPEAMAEINEGLQGDLDSRLRSKLFKLKKRMSRDLSKK